MDTDTIAHLFETRNKCFFAKSSGTPRFVSGTIEIRLAAFQTRSLFLSCFKSEKTQPVALIHLHFELVCHLSCCLPMPEGLLLIYTVSLTELFYKT